MKKFIALLLAVLMLTMVLASCGAGSTSSASSSAASSASSTSSASSKSSASSAASSSSAASGTTKDFSGKTLDVLYMVGGQGQMADPICEKLKSVYSGLTTTVVYDHKAGDIMRDRTLAGNPPDVFDVNSTTYDHLAAIDEGVVEPLDFLYDTPCVDDSSKTLKDILNFSTMNFGAKDGKYYLMPDCIYAAGVWYDAKMFKDNGWKVPTTWDEFYALGETAKAAGKSLLLYSTKYGGEYFFDYWFMPLLLSLDPTGQTYIDIQNMKEGAWTEPAAKKAFELTEDLIKKGYIDTTSGTLEISETQMQFCKGNTLFYSCGSWLEAEMAGNWPDGFELTFLPFPKQSASDPSFIMDSSVVSGVTAASKNKDIAAEYYRYMLSDPETTKKVVQTTQNGLPIKDFAKNYGSLLSNSVNSIWTAIGTKGSVTVDDELEHNYSTLYDFITDKSAALNSGSITGDDFAQAMEAFCASLRKDSDVTIRAYDSTALLDAIKSAKG